MKNILVTGGAGFLGSHLCETLLAKGNRVFCLDNFYTGTRENIVHLSKNPHFSCIEQDVRLPIDLHVDQIYNLACPASPRHYQRDPLFTTTTCLIGSINVLELAKKWGARVVQASTSEVYGNPSIHPQIESYFGNVNPIGERGCYDEGKRCAETLFFDYKRMHGTDIGIARIFNTYGPRMGEDDGRVISNFICQALRKDPITIYGDGSQTRSFCYVDDLIDALISLMEKGATGPINLGNPTETTIAALAKLVVEMTGSPSPIIYQPLPNDDPKVRRPDITKAHQLLGWTPSVSLRDGLKHTVQFFSNPSLSHDLLTRKT